MGGESVRPSEMKNSMANKCFLIVPFLPNRSLVSLSSEIYNIKGSQRQLSVSFNKKYLHLMIVMTLTFKLSRNLLIHKKRNNIETSMFGVIYITTTNMYKDG
jgi:hypothetical protein